MTSLSRSAVIGAFLLLASSIAGQASVRVNPRVMLEGCFVVADDLMHDSLRKAHLLPTDEPYAELGYVHVGNGGTESTTGEVLNAEGGNAVVDWVVLELRDAMANGFRVATRSALLQRDGDIVEMDGTSAVEFDVPSGNYYFSIKHRNHLGVMTATALTFGPDGTFLDFTQATTAVWGNGARKEMGPRQVLWCGDATGNGQVKYTGGGNDRDPILSLVGGTTPNAMLLGYYRHDVNMDGRVKYTGSGNDRDRILQTVGGTTPNALRTAQVP